MALTELDQLPAEVIASCQAEIERLKAELNKHWKLQPEDVFSGDIGSFL